MDSLSTAYEIHILLSYIGYNKCGPLAHIAFLALRFQTSNKRECEGLTDNAPLPHFSMENELLTAIMLCYGADHLWQWWTIRQYVAVTLDPV